MYFDVKMFLKESVDAYKVVRCRGSHIFYTIGSQTAVKLSALRIDHVLSPPSQKDYLIIISVRG
jgi:hypothetical protein